MKIYLFIYFIVSLTGVQATSIAFSNSPLEDYKAYMKGLCAAISTDCDLDSVSSCWDDTSAAGCLNMMYQAYVSVLNSTPQERSTVFKRFFADSSSKYVTAVLDAIRCEENLSYARPVYEKISTPEQAFGGIVENIIHYAAVKPEDCFVKIKNAVTLAEQGNFEAVGLLDGNFMSQAFALKKEEDSDWRKNAKNGRRLLFKGMCKSLSLDCSMDSLNSMDEENSARELHFLHEWFSSVAAEPKENGAKSGVEFLLGKGKELLSQIPASAIECDDNSAEVKLMSEKLGFDLWSTEWYETMVAFMNEFPETSWHYKVSEHQLLKNNDLEGVGVVLGLDWYHVAQWKHGRLGKEMSTMMNDL